MMTKDKSLQLLRELIERVETADTDDFFDLAHIAGLNPLQDFSEADLGAIDLRSKNMSGADSVSANLADAHLIIAVAS